MRFSLVRFLCFSLVCLVGLSARIASAQALTYDGQDLIARIQKAIPGVTTVATANGVTATAANDVVMRPSLVKVPVSVAANVSKARILSGALGCTSLVGAVACAATAAAVINELANRPVGLGRYRICPDGTAGFMCTEIPPPTPQTAYRYQYPAYSNLIPADFYIPRDGSCTAVAGAINGQSYPSNPNYKFTGVALATSPSCTLQIRNPVGGDTTSTSLSVTTGPSMCPGAGGGPAVAVVNGVCPGTAQIAAASPAQLEQSLQEKMTEDFQANRRLYDAMKADQAAVGYAKYPSTRDPVAPDTPVQVTAAPVTSPQRTVSTETIPNPDASTSTRTKVEQTTFTPQTSGTTVADSKTTFPSQTITTTTTVNNTTGATSVETNTTNNYSPSAEPSSLELPTDYARDATVAEVRDAINANGAPTAPDQEQRVTTEVASTNQKIKTEFDAIPNAFDSDKAKWFSWVWTPPVGQCSPFAGVVHGFDVSFDLCPTINNIKDALGWVFALFGAIQIYGLIFKQ
jgi:hypothetical protein